MSFEKGLGMNTQLWCPNPYEWLDMTVDWGSHSQLGLAICSQCWATHDCKLGQPKFSELATLDLDAIWNSERVRGIRKQMFRSIPRMCKNCPRLARHESPILKKGEIDDHYYRQLIDLEQTATMPKVLNVGYDPSCNLACPSCRTRTITLTEEDIRYKQLKHWQDRVVRPVLRQARWAFFAGYGDPFGSRLYEELLTTLTPEECPDLRLYILTNGLRFTKQVYDAIPLRDRIETIQFSIDAATAETYAINRGGSFRRLTDNLEFASGLLRCGKIKQLEMGFVFQANNWREIPAFCEWAKSLSATKVMLYALLNHTKSECYSHHSVHDPQHPEHDDAMRVIEEAIADQEIAVHIEMPNFERAGIDSEKKA